ncbi:uncharacterized protein (DUF305 family) [Kineococcus xinjiangensis]|uniref:Uncharacterized protein (DUF305 family) n=1 Tax=Kineococcus xinjiangensis TaxID=512762 RepID=A0A2S6IWW0_9ACTN|nr:DUF305 domain-containing protein [Kineococcus xinjiangensis]PPK98828.1 uncharacterized protein (DUF305 family) [Kineococcus xinjiangensis]
MTSTFRTPARALGAAALLSLVLTACGGGEDTAGGEHDGHGAQSSPTSSASSSAPPATAEAGDAQFADADVTFARDMIVHHEGAVEMASLAADRAATPQVKELAEKIIAAQGPEIELMTSWLTAWGQPTASGGHAGHGDMPGMMSGQEMAALEAARGPEFDRLFLEGMVVHHEGALEMARTELAEGAAPEAKELAQRIEADQTREIAEMQKLLGNL